MTLKDEIISKCSQELIDSRDCKAIADVVSAGRVAPNKKEIGNGTVLEVLGINVGNTLLDVLTTDPQFRYVKPLIEQGRLLIGSPLVQATLQSLVPDVITQDQANALKAVGYSDSPVSAIDVANAMYNEDGSIK